MKKNNKIGYLVIICAVIFDQLSKFAVRKLFSLNSSFPIIKNILHLTYVQNTGITFGMLKGYNFVFIIISLLAGGFFGYAYYKNKKHSIQLGLILAGIIGNLIDRILLGSVVDFIDFRIWPIFNIADSIIFIGAVWLVLALHISKEDLF